MSLKHCVCSNPGYCDRYKREMSLEDWDVCRGGVFWLKERKVSEWLSGPSPNRPQGQCIFYNGPTLDEFGNQKIHRTCGCGGQRAVVPLINCLHPSHVDPMPDDCQSRCTHYKAN